MTDIEFRNDGSLLKYQHTLPNMAEDELDPFQYRLLGHYIRRYNDGKPHREGIRETAEVCQMSIGKVRSTRKELAEFGYIAFAPATEAERRQGIAGTITVVDRWLENMQRFSNHEGKGVQNSTQGGVQNSIDKREGEKTSTKDLPSDDGNGAEGEKPETTPSKQVSEANAPEPPVPTPPLSPEVTPPLSPEVTPPLSPEVTPYKAMFSAVCLHVFGITFDMQPDEDERSRIGLIASWLSGNLTKEMKSRNATQLSKPALPEHVKRFTDWYHAKYKTAETPRDLERFSEHWRAFGSEMATRAAAVRKAEVERQQKADDLPPPETEAERLARVEEMRRQKEAVRAQQPKPAPQSRTDGLWKR